MRKKILFVVLRRRRRPFSWRSSCPDPPLARHPRSARPGRQEASPGPGAKARRRGDLFAGDGLALEDTAGGPGAQDWLEHATPGNDIPFSAFAGARNTGVASRRGRPRAAVPGRRSVPPTRRARRPVPRSLGLQRRDRQLQPDARSRVEIDPKCVAGDCRLWLANAGGGVWSTNDALAAEPEWEYVSRPSSTTTSPRSRSTPTTSGRTPSGRAPASPTPAAAAARRAWASTRRRTAGGRGRGRSAPRSSRGGPWARSPCNPATRM